MFLALLIIRFRISDAPPPAGTLFAKSGILRTVWGIWGNNSLTGDFILGNGLSAPVVYGRNSRCGPRKATDYPIRGTTTK